MRVRGFRSDRVVVGRRFSTTVLGIRLRHNCRPGPRIRVSPIFDADGLVQTRWSRVQRRTVRADWSVIITIIIKIICVCRTP